MVINEIRRLLFFAACNTPIGQGDGVQTKLIDTGTYLKDTTISMRPACLSIFQSRS